MFINSILLFVLLDDCLCFVECSIFFFMCALFLLIVLDGQPLLASGGSSGVISIWNLEKRRLQSVIREAHDSSIISLHFFANEPVLMSSSADNSIKVRAFVLSFSMLDGNFLPKVVFLCE